MDKKLFVYMSLPLAGLVLFSSAVGLVYPEIYASATENWAVQTIGQDGIDLFVIVPVLTLSAIYARQGNDLAFKSWAATNIYLVYTFVIYCFGVRFNSLFLIYCLILGLASFSTGIYFYHLLRDGRVATVRSGVTKMITGYFLTALSVIFYLLWLSDILPAVVAGQMPTALSSTGLITNPVHVLDLSVVLPFVFLVGLLVLRGNSFGLRMAEPMIVFFVLMDITIAVLAGLLFSRGLEESYAVALIMGIHALMCVGMLAYLRNKVGYLRTSMQ
jgi:hypothetical protein